VFSDSVRYADRLAIEGPASVLMQQRPDGTTAIALSDPTMSRDQVSVVVRGRPLQLVEGDDGVEVSRVPGGTRVTAVTHRAYGKSFTATLRLG
jgi:hyaluronate lyase